MAFVSHNYGFPDSSPVTRAKLVAHLASGDLLDLSDQDKTGRTIDGSLLRAVLIDKNLPRDPRGLTVVGARITDDLDLSYCAVLAPVRLNSTDFKGTLTLAGATITGDLSLEESELNGRNDHGSALVADGLRVNGNVFMNRLKVADGGIRLQGATITGQLNLREAELNGKNTDGNALFADGLQVNGDVVMGKLKVADGALRLISATITGQLSLKEADLNGKNTHGNALGADGLQVDGGLFMDKLRVADGAVRLVGATITGPCSLTEAELNGRDEYGSALAAHGLQANSGLFLEKLKVADGAIRLAGATITGELNLIEAELNGRDEGGSALAADRLQVHGNVFLNKLKVADGGVSMTGATITGDLILTGAELNGRDNYDSALGAERLRVDGSVFLHDLKVAEGGILSLMYGRVGTLFVEWHLPRGGWHRHYLVGLRYDHIFGGPDTSVRQGIRWLASQADGPRAAQPYWQLADYYARVGNDSAARRLRVWSNVLQSRAHLRSWPRFLYGLTTGFGYYPFLALLWLAVLIGIDTAALNTHSSDFIPTKAPTISVPAAKDQKPVNSSVCDSRYPCFEPRLYAADTVVPVISLGQQDAWRLDDSRAGVGIQVTLLFTSALGWILTTLLIAGVGGLLRRS
jgi:hypothetical protein